MPGVTSIHVGVNVARADAVDVQVEAIQTIDRYIHRGLATVDGSDVAGHHQQPIATALAKWRQLAA